MWNITDYDMIPSVEKYNPEKCMSVSQCFSKSVCRMMQNICGLQMPLLSSCYSSSISLDLLPIQLLFPLNPTRTKTEPPELKASNGGQYYYYFFK